MSVKLGKINVVKKRAPMKGIVLTFLVPLVLWSASNPFEEEHASEPWSNRCLERVEIVNKLSADLLFASSAYCIQEEKYDQAADLYLTATAYGYFDSLRVADKSARSVLDTLKVTYFSPLDAKKRDRFASVLRDKLDHLASTCHFLESLGKPNYMPHYMIEAAKNPLSQKSPNGLVPNYNAKALWDETRLEYLRCR